MSKQQSSRGARFGATLFSLVALVAIFMMTDAGDILAPYVHTTIRQTETIPGEWTRQPSPGGARRSMDVSYSYTVQGQKFDKTENIEKRVWRKMDDQSRPWVVYVVDDPQIAKLEKTGAEPIFWLMIGAGCLFVVGTIYNLLRGDS